MTQPLTPAFEGPPLAAGVTRGDLVWVPAFACSERKGSPFWLRVELAGEVDGWFQDVTGVRVVPPTEAHAHPEAERTVTVTLPLDRTCRRVFRGQS